MGGKNKSRKARRTGSPIGNQEESSPDYEVTEEVYEVECVVGHRERRNGMEYKVRWRGWSPQFDEWLPYTKMDCPDVIKAYWENVEKEKEKKRRMSTSRKRERSDSVSSSKSDQKMPSGDSDHRPRSRQMFDQFKSRSKSPFVDAKPPTVPQNIDSTGEPAVSDGQDGCSNASPLLSATPHAATENQSTSTSACSSPPSSQQPILRKVVKIKPIPPALPNRKVIKSTFNVSCSSTSAAPSTSPAPKCAPVVSAENLNESTSYGSVAPESVKETGICNGITETNEESKDIAGKSKSVTDEDEPLEDLEETTSKKPPLTQQSLSHSFSMWSEEGQKTRDIERAIMQLICVDAFPIQTVEKPVFKNLLKVIIPQWKHLKSRTHFARGEPPRLFEEFENRLKAEPREVEWMTVSFDLFADEGSTHQIIGAVVHLVKVSSQVYQVLGLIDMKIDSY